MNKLSNILNSDLVAYAFAGLITTVFTSTACLWILSALSAK